MVHDVLRDAITLADKRADYCRRMEPCPSCGTEQVQLVDWIYGAEWKCRKCRHEWNGVTGNNT